MHGSLVTLAVIAAQIAGVSVGLVYVGVGRVQFSLELDHYDTVAEQQYRIGPPRFHRQLIFKDGGAAGVVRIDTDDFADFLLELRHRVAPRPAFFV